LLLTIKLLNKELVVVKLNSSLLKFYDRHNDMVNHKWPRIFTFQSYPHSCRLPLVEWKLLIFLEDPHF
jgi:hypothetical protein